MIGVISPKGLEQSYSFYSGLHPDGFHTHTYSFSGITKRTAELLAGLFKSRGFDPVVKAEPNTLAVTKNDPYDVLVIASFLSDGQNWPPAARGYVHTEGDVLVQKEAEIASLKSQLAALDKVREQERELTQTMASSLREMENWVSNFLMAVNTINTQVAKVL